MKKTQIILISVGLFLILMTYFYYPYMNNINVDKNELTKKDTNVLSDEGKEDQSNVFENVEYKGLYNLNKNFTVKSKKAHILSDEPDIVYMSDMHVILHLGDGRIVNIISNKGRYNKVTYDCFFEENVRATDGESKIFAENLDLLATKNFVEIYNDVSLNYPTGYLEADKLRYNFETKHFKVSMFDDREIKMKVIE